MAGESAFDVEGVIREVRSNGTFRVELPNGHCLTGFVAGKAKLSFVGRPDDKVRVRMSSYDLSKGRILLERKQI